MSNKYRTGQFADPLGGLIENVPNINLVGTFAGTPTYTTGYEKGAMIIDITNGLWYRNSGTRTAAVWTGAGGGTGAFTTLAATTVTGNPAGSTVAFTDRITTTDGVSSGTAGVVGRLLSTSVAASTAIASTSAETVFDSNYNMPANTLKAGSVIKIRFQGIQTALVGTDTLAFKLYIGGSGGTALITSAATTGVSNGTILGECTLVCRTAGTTGTFVSVGTFKVVSAEGTMTVKDDITASTTINTQAAQLITATATFNTTNANSVRMDVFTVEIF